MKFFHKHGFTLIELLVVMVVVGILATISTATFRNYINQANDTQRVVAAGTVKKLMETEKLRRGLNYYWDLDNDGDIYDLTQEITDILADNGYVLPEDDGNACLVLGVRNLYYTPSNPGFTGLTYPGTPGEDFFVAGYLQKGTSTTTSGYSGVSGYISYTTTSSPVFYAGTQTAEESFLHALGTGGGVLRNPCRNSSLSGGTGYPGSGFSSIASGIIGYDAYELN